MDIETEFSKFCRVKRVHLVVDRRRPSLRQGEGEEEEEDEEEEEAAAAMVVQAGYVPAAPGARVEKPAGPRTRLVLFKRDAWKFHPYDCDAGNSNREAAWVDDKTLWCCTDEQKGCPK